MNVSGIVSRWLGSRSLLAIRNLDVKSDVMILIRGYWKYKQMLLHELRKTSGACAKIVELIFLMDIYIQSHKYCLACEMRLRLAKDFIDLSRSKDCFEVRNLAGVLCIAHLDFAGYFGIRTHFFTYSEFQIFNQTRIDSDSTVGLFDNLYIRFEFISVTSWRGVMGDWHKTRSNYPSSSENLMVLLNDPWINILF